MLVVAHNELHGSARAIHELSSAETIPSPQAGTTQQDTELLRMCSEFHDVNAELDRLVCGEGDPAESRLFALHKRWHEACRRAISLAARTVEGRRAKAAMLICVLDVVLGPATDRDLHELLADSLARDLLR